MKVLVVDDDVVSRMVLMHLIDSCGSFEILEAEDGEDAWTQLEQGLRPAICFCDLRMPRLSGMDLLQRVKAGGAHEAMPFVLVTSATDSDTLAQATGLGAAGYIVKPFQVDQVRVHMTALSGAGLAPSEPPLSTMARLAISSERLLVYLGGFQGQLTAASAELDHLIGQGDHNEARLRLERLRAGCVTLGLTGAAATLACFHSIPLDSEDLHVALADAVRAVMQQGELVKRLGPAS